MSVRAFVLTTPINCEQLQTMALIALERRYLSAAGSGDFRILRAICTGSPHQFNHFHLLQLHFVLFIYKYEDVRETPDCGIQFTLATGVPFESKSSSAPSTIWIHPPLLQLSELSWMRTDTIIIG